MAKVSEDIKWDKGILTLHGLTEAIILDNIISISPDKNTWWIRTATGLVVVPAGEVISLDLQDAKP